jgi:hypothetical protein
MKSFYKVTFCFLLAIVCANEPLHAQQATGEKGNGRQTAAEQNKTSQNSDNKPATQSGDNSTTANKDAGKEIAPRRWGIQISTGEKWYQLNVKLVM